MSKHSAVPEKHRARMFRHSVLCSVDVYFAPPPPKSKEREL